MFLFFFTSNIIICIIYNNIFLKINQKIIQNMTHLIIIFHYVRQIIFLQGEQGGFNRAHFAARPCQYDRACTGCAGTGFLEKNDPCQHRQCQHYILFFCRDDVLITNNANSAIILQGVLALHKKCSACMSCKIKRACQHDMKSTVQAHVF